MLPACWGSLRGVQCWVRWPGAGCLQLRWKCQALGCSEASVRPQLSVLAICSFLTLYSLRRVASPKQTPQCISRTVRLPPGPPPTRLTFEEAFLSLPLCLPAGI